MNAKSKILLVGDAVGYGRVASFRRAFQESGNEVEVLDTRPLYRVSFPNRVLNRFLTVPVFFGTGRINNAVIAAAQAENPDVILFFKPVLIKAATVSVLKERGAKVFLWYPDYLFHWQNMSRDCLQALPLYDFSFFMNDYPDGELRKLGVSNWMFLRHAVDPRCHDRVLPEGEDERKKLGADVVFIGTYAPEERVSFLERLCKENYDIKIYGDGWEKLSSGSCLRRRGCVQFRAAYCAESSKIMNSSKITLAFLRRHNKAEETARTYEIPACGAFMLHSRSRNAAALFKEGEEAEFFDSYEELKQKIDYYLSHPSEAERIAQHGYLRAHRPDYSYADRARKIMEVYEKLK